jgi:hypothetical protein
MIIRNPEMNTIELKTIAFLRLSNIRVITRDHETGDFLIKFGRTIIRIDAEQIAGATRHLDWILFPPDTPWRPERIAWRRPTEADFSEITFRTFITIDNLYQGYLQTEDISLLLQIARQLVPRPRRPFRKWELLAIFKWVESVKDFFARKFPDFFQPLGESDSLSGKPALPTRKQLEDAMNAQIRALTKGDITREEEILDMPCWRALIELDAQAREYLELKRQTAKS